MRTRELPNVAVARMRHDTARTCTPPPFSHALEIIHLVHELNSVHLWEMKRPLQRGHHAA